ncbi:hypothetical protein DEU56DRAFT_910612 [Suillus clintonianus]|uniref:uncharacterized protein n=1 Tax=Suillus clintonianus TaxID=1904413 RepID=UPI001B8820FA|nr:uncharacterized protein DEU56DRAFT_910612 [Suillus clintonianus]KAG2144257.1 hypothetical protein DEU56DRAFT_910612 [Suillus clintonianus]
MSEQLQEAIIGLRWNDSISVALFTVMSYEYLLLLDKEVKYVWKRPWSLMSCLYLVVRYLGLSLALSWGCWGGMFYIPESPYVTLTASIIHVFKLNSHHAIGYDILVVLEWGASVYFCFAETILMWRLYAMCNQSKLLLYVLGGSFLPIIALLIGTDIYLYSRPNAFSVKELVTPNAKYCTFSFNMGPMPAIYTSIPIVCYDIFLVFLAAATLVRHLKEWREYRMRPNSYVVMIVRYHMMYFVLNLTNQILMVILWAHIPTPAMDLSELFSDTMPFILAPRLIISIWDTHAEDDCVYVSAPFADCVCWTSPARFEQHETQADILLT